MRNGRLLPGGSPDDVVKGSPRDPSLFGGQGHEGPAESGAREEPRERAASAAR